MQSTTSRVGSVHPADAVVTTSSSPDTCRHVIGRSAHASSCVSKVSSNYPETRNLAIGDSTVMENHILSSAHGHTRTELSKPVTHATSQTPELQLQHAANGRVTSIKGGGDTLLNTELWRDPDLQSYNPDYQFAEFVPTRPSVSTSIVQAIQCSHVELPVNKNGDAESHRFQPRDGHVAELPHPTLRLVNSTPNSYETSEKNALMTSLANMKKERDDLVFKLLQFVKTNDELHNELDTARARNHDLEKQMDALRRSAERLEANNSKLEEKITQMSGLRSFELEQYRESAKGDHGLAQATQHPCDSRSSSDGLSSGVREELLQAIQLAASQQQELANLRRIIKKQHEWIEKLCHRDSVLGLEIRRQNSNGQERAPNVVPSAAAMARVSGDVVRPQSPQSPARYSTSVSSAGVPAATAAGRAIAHPNNLQQTGILLVPDDGVSYIADIEPIRRPSDSRSNTAPPEPPVRQPANVVNVRPSAGTTATERLSSPIDRELEGLPPGFEMTTACPICQLPIPFDASSSEVFSRHVDECISRVTRDGPPGVRASDRKCPVCDVVFPTERYTQAEFERHVDNHFARDEPLVNQFVEVD